MSSCLGGEDGGAERSAQSEEGQDRENDDDGTDEPDEIVHGFFS